MLWVISVCLAIPAALLHMAGVPLIGAVAITVLALLAVVAAVRLAGKPGGKSRR